MASVEREYSFGIPVMAVSQTFSSGREDKQSAAASHWHGLTQCGSSSTYVSSDSLQSCFTAPLAQSHGMVSVDGWHSLKHSRSGAILPSWCTEFTVVVRSHGLPPRVASICMAAKGRLAAAAVHLRLSFSVWRPAKKLGHSLSKVSALPHKRFPFRAEQRCAPSRRGLTLALPEHSQRHVS